MAGWRARVGLLVRWLDEAALRQELGDPFVEWFGLHKAGELLCID